MNKQQEVIQEIRTQLPRLMELEKGCLISSINNKLYEVIAEYKGLVKIHLISERVDYTSTIEKYIILDDNTPYKIIGKEPTILDLLEVLDFGGETNTLINEFGRLCSYNEITKEFNHLPISFSLSKPLVKDLEEETINFLHSVLCKK